ncbi:fumarylacetoacetate hydrolase family protein [Ilyonectria robusta]|uniref:fumarylacetoacetate hydrolase family protein n=1 Tax=Ilyonectria robusta TaxID=1079257 RepID=UPI001E8EF432|nr:fumarylacetoacetate hydrolase family protein [Ilyonectria robusta]KAH8652911.1 fumarylacetoacetate hydrolase family protein [Ilyonectria robusta]
MASFTSIFRFRSLDGEIYYGEAGGSDCHTKESLVGRSVPVFKGEYPWDEDFSWTDERKEVSEVVCPLPRTPIFLCVGLNYRQHVAEGGLTVGEYPTIFTKPPDALAGPYDDIFIHPECRFMDYEAELCFVLRKDCKNLSQSDNVTEYILGYTGGNDVSSRWWQMPARSNDQHGTAKGFDKFAPIGPVITSTSAIPDPKQLRMECFVNGDMRQSTLIGDQIFDIPKILEHLSRGTTLRKGTVIMTGTPSGVAAAMNPPPWLKDGDVVEVKIDRIGSTSNQIRYES